jgi:proteic killer suppression protein
MIRTFADKTTATIFEQRFVKRIDHAVQRRARAKLIPIDEAGSLLDLSQTPGNRLEALRGNRDGQFSIRVNDQWRICFRWEDEDAFDVELADYH